MHQQEYGNGQFYNVLTWDENKWTDDWDEPLTIKSEVRVDPQMFLDVRDSDIEELMLDLLYPVDISEFGKYILLWHWSINAREDCI